MSSSDSEVNWRVGNKGFDKYRYMFEHALNTDCTFHIGDQQIGAHRVFLIAASPVFEAMLQAQMSENKTGVITITDISYSTFKSVLRYMYTNQIELNGCEDAVEIYVVADKYQLDDLRELCEERITNDLSPDNVWKVIDLAQTLSIQTLLDQCAQILQLQTQACCMSAHLKNLSEDHLMLLLSQDTLSLHGEISLVVLTERWARSKAVERGLHGTDCDVREVLLPRVLPLLRLATLNDADFDVTVNLCGWLTEEDKHVLASKNTNDFPNYLCKNINSRNWQAQATRICDASKLKHSVTINLPIKIQKNPIQNITASTGTICSFDITVSESILLNKMTISTQVNPKKIVSDIFEPLDIYKENLTVTVKIYNSSVVVGTSKFEGQVAYDSTLTFEFCPPVELHKSKFYTVEVTNNKTLNNFGWYQIPNSASVPQFILQNILFKLTNYSSNISLFKSLNVSICNEPDL